eukprot:GHVT01015759.1.p1 GENE.GHVT01015759.1~~GHVT01015759.1.p1  ORF type:complete len:151 (-),score=29.21 GHVT01015759.1:357-809(-)
MCGPGLPFECADDFQHGFEFFEFEGRKFIVQTAADQVAPPPRSHRVRRLLPSCLFSRELEMPRFRQTPGVHPRELSNVPRLPTAQLLRSDACQALGNFFFAAGLGAAKGQGRLHGVDVDGRRRCGVACVGFRGASRPRQIDGAAVSRLVD